MTITLDQLQKAQSTVQPGAGGYVMLNPATGQYERAFSGVAYGDMGVQHPEMGNGTTRPNDAQGGTYLVPESLANELQATRWQRQPGGPWSIFSGLSGPVDTPFRAAFAPAGPGSNSGLDNFMENNAGPLLMSAMAGGAFGGFGIPGAAPSGLGSMLSAGAAGAGGFDPTAVDAFGTGGSEFLGATGGTGAGAAGASAFDPLAERLFPSFAEQAAAPISSITPVANSLGDKLAQYGIPGAQSVFGTAGAAAAGTAAGAASGAAGAGGAGGATAGATGLASLLGLTGTAATAVDALGRAIPGLVGAYAANKQSDNLADLARESRASDDARFKDLLARDDTRYATALAREDAAIGRQRGDIQFGRDVGQPSRDRYEGSYAPGFDITADPALKSAMESQSDTLLRRLSAQSGNPFGDPGGLIEANKSVLSGVALPYLQNYRSQNAATGGYGSYAGAGANPTGTSSGLPTGTSLQAPGANTQLDLASLTSGANVWNALGSSASSVFNPPSSLEELLKKFKGSNIFGVQ